MKKTPSIIRELRPGEIFVFGSNSAGIHGKGAAKDAVAFGAVRGCGKGPRGQTYAIATKDANLRTLPLAAIEIQIGEFLRWAERHPDQTFLVTPIGCGLAGYSADQIAPLFFKRAVPENVALPESFWNIFQQ